ncbi:hypothetical protein OC835_000782 [Tilletia horrida]|nr:hypothetical protein OC835_000782 [Tilletia horrida]
MRLWCPARFVARQVPYDDVLPLSRPIRLRDGTLASEIKVKKGQDIRVPVSYLNRDESLWGADGNVFKAERWLPAGHELKGADSELDMDPSVKELRGTWSNLATFGAVAIMEFKTITAHLLTSFEILPANLPSEPPVELETIMKVVSHPILKGDKIQDVAMPVRLKLLSS